MINKIAQPSYWPKVIQKVKTLGLRPEIVAMLNNFNQIVWEVTPPSGNANAVAYVSSEDLNDDGKIDKIHFVSSNFPPNASDEEIDGIVAQVAKTLVHEYGHIDDFDAEKGVFPGGEGAAEAAERAAEGMIEQKLQLAASDNTTNKKNRIDNVIKSGELEGFLMQKELIKLANHLDSIGHSDLADRLDSLTSTAGTLGGIGDISDSKKKPMPGWVKGLLSEFVDNVEEVGATIRGKVKMIAEEEVASDPSPGIIARVKNRLRELFNENSTAAESATGTTESSEPTPVDEKGEWSPVDETGERSDEESPEPLPQEVEVSDNVHDRINKLAELMSREFTNVPRGFTR
jgi:hypothetical protein